MERAAQACADWIIEQGLDKRRRFICICGKGNNGGDGLAMSRLLHHQGYHVITYILSNETIGTNGFETNLRRLENLPVEIRSVQTPDEFPAINNNDIIIDALFGCGLNKPLEGVAMLLVNHVNLYAKTIISIDLPSGLFADQFSKDLEAVKATHTLSFQVFKKALLVAENAPFIGEVHILDIGLHKEFMKGEKADEKLIDKALIKSIFKPRERFSHKGSHGHALLIGGSYGTIGAITLSTNACLRSGAGLVSTYAPACGYNILQAAAPEAMVISDKENNFLASTPSHVGKYNAVGVGPGMGTETQTRDMVRKLLSLLSHHPVVWDADAMNCLSFQKDLTEALPQGSILTPHPKEFERLFGKSDNDFERLLLARRKAEALKIIIVLKGHHTFIALPDGTGYFNNNGNAGMAKGGSGDVLTGLITGLLAQNYTQREAALLGVFIHGLAGDLAAKELSKEAMTAGDLIRFLPGAFLQINKF